MGRLRFRSRTLAALSIVLVLASALAGWHAPDDADEYLAPAVHHHADHDARLSAASQPTAPEHCALCHWLRAFGSSSPVAVQSHAPEAVLFVGLPDAGDRVRAASQLTLPARAPPLA